MIREVARKRRLRGGLAAVEKEAGTWHPLQRGVYGVELVDEFPKRPLVALALACDEFAAFLPGGEDRERRDGDQQGKPGSVHELGQVGGEEQEVTTSVRTEASSTQLIHGT